MFIKICNNTIKLFLKQRYYSFNYMQKFYRNDKKKKNALRKWLTIHRTSTHNLQHHTIFYHKISIELLINLINVYI